MKKKSVVVYIFPAIIILLCCIVYGCEKVPKNISNIANPLDFYSLDINNNYIDVVGDSIEFICDDGTNHSYLWSFGDGTTSTSGIHIYSAAGTYSVGLTVDNVVDTVEKGATITIYKNPGFTNAVCEPKVYHGVKQVYTIGLTDTVTTTLPDTTFELSQLNNVEVDFIYNGTNNVAYYQPDSLYGSQLIYSNINFLVNSTPYIMVYFNTVSDSTAIYYRNSSVSNPVTITTVSYHYP